MGREACYEGVDEMEELITKIRDIFAQIGMPKSGKIYEEHFTATKGKSFSTGDKIISLYKSQGSTHMCLHLDDVEYALPQFINSILIDPKANNRELKIYCEFIASQSRLFDRIR